MGTITATNMRASGAVAVAVTTLTSSDSFAYNSALRAVLILNNVTGGALSPVIDGDEATSVGVPGVGDRLQPWMVAALVGVALYIPGVLFGETNEES